MITKSNRLSRKSRGRILTQRTQRRREEGKGARASRPHYLESGRDGHAPFFRICSGRGFTLIEVTLALGVAGFCLLAIFGLLPVGLTSNQASINQTTAANISSAIVADLRSAPSQSGTTASPRFGFSIPGPSGSSPSVTSTAALQTIYLTVTGGTTGAVGSGPVYSGTAPSLYRATLAFGAPGAGQRTASPVRVLVTWPAAADPKPLSWPNNYTGSYEADTTLDRN